MGYPRACPRCSAAYAVPWEGTVTLDRRVGGAADPRRPGRPGPLLRLRCLACEEPYWWDFFEAEAVGDPA